jgi:hypothetical protein
MLGQEYNTCSAKAFWEDFLEHLTRTNNNKSSLSKQQGNLLPLLQVNTMHKQKGVKVEPVNNSSQEPQTVSGRLN